MIAIQGHSTRGKEVIQILENLGGKNIDKLEGFYKTFYYIDNNNEISDEFKNKLPPTYKFYTLEEFEKEFPFKIGDKVKDCSDNEVGIILGFIDIDGELMYVVNFEKSGHANMPTEELKLYKEMNEERNITLTLEKAKEWYKKGGELKEIALQAFTEKELNPLPRSWEEFCKKYPVKEGESWLGEQSRIHTCTTVYNGMDRIYKNWIPSKKSAEAHLAMIQLEQLRDCWRQGWEPDWLNGNTTKYAIKAWRDKSSIETTYVTHAFLSFPTYELAFEFQECFRDLIKKAGDLI